jgi:putative membrane protein
MVMRLALGLAVNVAAFFIASLVLEDVDFSNFGALIVAALVFGVVNTLIGTLVRFFLKTAGILVVLLTFGVVLFFVNVFMLYITSWIVDGFEIGSFGAACGAAAIIWLVQTVFEAALRLGRKD